MKKTSSVLMILVILISMAAVCYAGDIPETQLSEDNSQTFIGEVKELTPESITVIQKYNFKGEFEKDKEYTYKDSEKHRPDYVKVGESVLCCYTDADNFYTYEIESFDEKKIKLVQQDDMAQRLQEYINDGSFAKAEQERLAKASLADAMVSPSAIPEVSAVPTIDPEATPRVRATSTPRVRATATPKASASPSASPKATSSATASSTATPKANPKTGDSAPLAGLSMLCVLALAAIAVVQVKKKNN